MDTQKNDILDEALAAWRESAQEETLSGPGRTALFNEVRSIGDGSGAAFVPGLTRAWRWAFLGSFPVVALAVVLIAGRQPEQIVGVAPELSAAKVHGQLVFTLANGKTEHMVYRSTDPQSFDRSAAVKMARNRYAEDATGGPSLVFYRID